jgi:hypothetical protein
MPTIGDLSPRRCSECSGEMVWIEDAVRDTDARVYPGYRCANGHVSQACGVCGSRNTTRFGAGPLNGRRILSCDACGNLAAFTVAD